MDLRVKIKSTAINMVFILRVEVKERIVAVAHLRLMVEISSSNKGHRNLHHAVDPEPGRRPAGSHRNSRPIVLCTTGVTAMTAIARKRCN